MDAGDRLLSTRQTSLVVDPPDGRVPVRAWAATDREELPLTRAPGYEMYEYASHERNLDVAIYLGGGRVEEAGR